MPTKGKDNVSRPSAGPVRVHGEKGEASVPSSGLVAHPEKAAYDQKHGRAGLNKPEAGARDRGKDPKNATHPGAGIADQHLDKHAFEKARKHEPKPAKGAKYADGSTTTKCN
jgi:hypothetical protein